MDFLAVQPDGYLVIAAQQHHRIPMAIRPDVRKRVGHYGSVAVFGEGAPEFQSPIRFDRRLLPGDRPVVFDLEASVEVEIRFGWEGSIDIVRVRLCERPQNKVLGRKGSD